MIGRTNAAARAGFVKGGDVLVSHSAGASGMIDHGVVTMEDGDFRLLEVKQSGTVSFNDAQLERGIKADLCLVNGGQGGGRGYANYGGYGGRLINVFGMHLDDLVVTIGAGGTGASTNIYGGLGGQTSVRRSEDTGSVAPMTGAGTGGGQGGCTSSAGTYQNGDGVNKKPFGDASYFNPHCGGGGGGALEDSSSGNYSGGAGGTNGGNGVNRYPTGSPTGQPGVAGDSSAGTGGTYNAVGGNAAYYGGGGGGGGARTTGTYQNGGSGHQGCVWIRISA